MSNQPAVTVFYDGLCPICSREVRLYKKLNTGVRLDWSDLRHNQEVLKTEGFSYQSAMELLHVKDQFGQLHIGIEAHLCMWSQLRYFRYLAAVLKAMPRLTRVLEKFYIVFTRYRPGLARQQNGAAHD
ncbi:MAG: DUF393 domain-containing protein [Pseudomonadota bacterium]